MKIEDVDPATPAVQRLVAESDAYMAQLYPAESNHFDDALALKRPNVRFVAAFEGDAVVGCGAVKTLDDDGLYGEIKRVFVAPGHRGRGISKALMAVLEGHLVERGVTIARLETGILQPEAIGLYRRLGYVERGPYGRYRADPLSLFMEKLLLPAP